MQVDYAYGVVAFHHARTFTGVEYGGLFAPFFQPIAMGVSVQGEFVFVL